MLSILVFYGLYTFTRNNGVATDSARRAFAHARSVIRLERLVGLYHEQAIQEAFLGNEAFIRVWNIFYGTAHFIVTAATLVWLFRRRPALYPRWRNTLAFTTALALIGFTFFPLMPPRLLPPSYGYVDTLADVGGLWSFESGAVAKMSNQYAAMPSLHFGWAAWSAAVLVRTVRRRWARALALAYPLMTLFAIVVTANHFWLDAVGGALALGVGAGLAAAVAGGGIRGRRLVRTPGAGPGTHPQPG